jgi:hypothetical protein
MRVGAAADAGDEAPPPALLDHLLDQDHLLDHLPPPALAALVSHLPAPDLLRFGLSSHAAAAALAEIPHLHETAAAVALGWPSPRSGRGGSSEQQRQQRQQQSQHQQQHARPPDAAAAAGGGARAGGAPGPPPGRPGHGGPLEGDAAYRALLSAACALASAAAPHCLRAQATAPGLHAAAALGKAGGFVAADPAALSPPLELTAEQQRALTLGGPGGRRARPLGRRRPRCVCVSCRNPVAGAERA